MPSKKRKSKAVGKEYFEEMRLEDRREAARNCYYRNREKRLERQKVYDKRRTERQRQERLELQERLKDDPEYQEQRRKALQAQTAKATATRKANEEEWRELGWIVAKMNIVAGLSQDEIYNLLGGLVTRQKIQKWCRRGKKLRKLRRPR